MFFDSFNRRMKKAYYVLDSTTKEIVFPKGEIEFMYVATLLNNNFQNRELATLFPMYGSIKAYVLMEKGNLNYIYEHSKKIMNGFSEKEIFTMIAIATLTILPSISLNDISNNMLDQMKMSIKAELNTILQISEHLDIFGTKNNDKIGTIDNPILLPGISGVEKYFDNLVTSDDKEIEFKRDSCMYLTDSKTNINYALDEYKIYYKGTKNKICSIFVNEYGTTQCEYYPKGFKRKQEK